MGFSFIRKTTSTGSSATGALVAANSLQPTPSSIARALGEELTLQELIPFLNENNDDDDEVPLAMADERGGFIPYVRGVEHAHELLPPLETLCIVEDTVVREKAVESLCSIGAQMKGERCGRLVHSPYQGKHTLLTRMSICVAETSRLGVPRGPTRICAGNRDAAATGLVQASSLDGLEPPWVRLAPPRFFPQEGELIWLIPDTQHELRWDYSMCADTSRGTAVWELIARSLKGALTPAQQQELVENFLVIAVEVLLKLMNSSQNIEACWMVQLLQGAGDMDMSLHSMEVVNRLTTAIDLPTEFVHTNISNCISSCQNIKHGKPLEDVLFFPSGGLLASAGCDTIAQETEKNSATTGTTTASQPALLHNNCNSSNSENTAIDPTVTLGSKTKKAAIPNSSATVVTLNPITL